MVNILGQSFNHKTFLSESFCRINFDSTSNNKIYVFYIEINFAEHQGTT